MFYKLRSRLCYFSTPNTFLLNSDCMADGPRPGIQGTVRVPAAECRGEGTAQRGRPDPAWVEPGVCHSTVG